LVTIIDLVLVAGYWLFLNQQITKQPVTRDQKPVLKQVELTLKTDSNKKGINYPINKITLDLVYTQFKVIFVI